MGEGAGLSLNDLVTDWTLVPMEYSPSRYSLVSAFPP